MVVLLISCHISWWQLIFRLTRPVPIPVEHYSTNACGVLLSSGTSLFPASHARQREKKKRKASTKEGPRKDQGKTKERPREDQGAYIILEERGPHPPPPLGTLHNLLIYEQMAIPHFRTTSGRSMGSCTLGRPDMPRSRRVPKGARSICLSVPSVLFSARGGGSFPWAACRRLCLTCSETHPAAS